MADVKLVNNPEPGQDRDFKDIEGSSESCYGSCMNFCGNFLSCLSWLVCSCNHVYVTINQGEKGVISKFGKIMSVVEPGVYYINPCTHKINVINVQIQTVEVKKQDVITKDNCFVQIDSVINYQVEDVFKAIYCIKNVDQAIITQVKSNLRTTISSRTFQDALDHRSEISAEIKKVLTDKMVNWGILVESVQIEDIIISHELQITLSSAAKATRFAESKIISAKADVESAQLMKAAADLLSTPAAMQIRTLETLTTFAKSDNCKVIIVPANYGSIGQDCHRMLVAKEYTDDSKRQ